MTHHRKPLLSARMTQVAGKARDGALGAQRHRIAMTVLGSTVAVGAVLGSVLTTEPVALAASTQQENPVAAPVRSVGPAAPQAPPVSTMVQSMIAPQAVVPTTTPTPAKPVVAQAPAPAAKAPAPAPKPRAATKAEAPPASNPYAGESAYQVAEGIVPSGQFSCFDWIVTRESGWNVTASNPSSGAYGLGQALPGDKMASAGSDWQTNPATQIKWTLGYMDERYGSPCEAQSFWESHGWY